MQYVNVSIFALLKFVMEFAVWPDARDIDYVLRMLTRGLDDRGPYRGATEWKCPVMGQLRLQLKDDYDARLPPHVRPELSESQAASAPAAARVARSKA